MLDPWLPYVAGCEIHDNPYTPICRRCRMLIAENGDETTDCLARRRRPYVEKLATSRCHHRRYDRRYRSDQSRPTGAGYFGRIDRALRSGSAGQSAAIFAINELPDPCGARSRSEYSTSCRKATFQIKRAIPCGLPLDLLLVFTANPEDYTRRAERLLRAQRSHRQRNPDALSSNPRTRYRDHPGEAWLDRQADIEVHLPNYIAEIVEQLAFSAREDKRVDKRSGVSQRLRSQSPRTLSRTPSAAPSKTAKRLPCRACSIFTRRCPRSRARSSWSMRASSRRDAVSRELIRAAVSKVYDRYFEGVKHAAGRAMVSISAGA